MIADCIFKTATAEGVLFPHEQNKELDKEEFAIFIDSCILDTKKYTLKNLSQCLVWVGFSNPENYKGVKVEMRIFEDSDNELVILNKELKKNFNELSRVFNDTKRILKKVRFAQQRQRHAGKGSASKQQKKESKDKKGEVTPLTHTPPPQSEFVSP